MDRGARLNTSAGGYPYCVDDQQRWVPEPDKRGQFELAAELSPGEPSKAASATPIAARRGEFQRDRARVLHSYAFRRLADKTQVVSPGQDDFPRTRLTHSLEVAQIAREVGAELGCDPDVTDAAGLAHDLGHPPFGHNGEAALDELTRSIGGFEGNAQTLRILTRLEPKVSHPEGDPAGLNLTRAALDAVCKYPWPAGAGPAGSAKFGVYEHDRAAYEWMRAGRPDGERSLEAQVMDWADDVAYSVHDIEDGVHSGYIHLDALTDAHRHELCVIAATDYSNRTAHELAPVLESLLRLPALLDLADYDGTYRAQAAAKGATSELTGRFTGAAVAATRARYGGEPLGRYSADLVVPRQVVDECALLKAIAQRYVMRRPGVEAVLVEQRALLATLTEALFDSGGRYLSASLRASWQVAGDDAGRLRVVVDQVAQLTDSSARAWYARLCGGVGTRT